LFGAYGVGGNIDDVVALYISWSNKGNNNGNSFVLVECELYVNNARFGISITKMVVYVSNFFVLHIPGLVRYCGMNDEFEISGI
jgi:hypothetical protein